MRDYGKCTHPEMCAGTDSGGNCRLMRNQPWDKRDCWFNSDYYHYDTEAGQAEALENARYTIATLAAAGLCTNCGHRPEEHVDGLCPQDDEVTV